MDYSQLTNAELNRLVAEAMGFSIAVNDKTGICILVGKDESAISPICISEREAWAYAPDYLHDPVALEDVKRSVIGNVYHHWSMIYVAGKYDLAIDNDRYVTIAASGLQPTEARAWCVAYLMLKESEK